MKISPSECTAVAHAQDGLDPFQLVLQAAAAPPQFLSPISALVGQLIAIPADGSGPRVHCAALGAVPMPARSTVILHRGHIGCSVVLVHEHGDPHLPIIVGVMQDQTTLPCTDDGGHLSKAEGRVLLEAKDGLTLRCGNATICLESDGTVHVRGARVVTEADGAVRVRGASIQLN